MDGFTGGCVTMDLYLGNMTGQLWLKLQDQSGIAVTNNPLILYHRKFSLENTWNVLAVDLWSLTGNKRLVLEIQTQDPERGVVAAIDNIMHNENRSCNELGGCDILRRDVICFQTDYSVSSGGIDIHVLQSFQIFLWNY